MSIVRGTLRRATGQRRKVQWSIPQNWLRQATSRLEPALGRLSSRRNELGVALALTAFFAVAGGLRPAVALVGLGAVAAWAALRRGEDFAGLGRAGRLNAPSADAERLWRMVVDAVPEPAIALDGAGQIVHANRRAEELFGARRRSGHLASMSRDPELLAAVDDVLASRQGRAVELQTRVPVERRLLAIVAALDTSASRGGGPALLISFRDLTEQDRLARMRADFVANASHELRTPLASLRGFVETLQGAAKDDPEARERFLKVMSEQAERMSRLVDDLLSLSRVEMREHLPLVERVDLNDALARVIQALQPLAAKTDTTIAFEALSEPAIVRGDRDELVQVFQNLIQNAVKYGKAGGRIEVRVAREPAAAGRPARYLASVKDEGPGIAPQHLPRLTERFYRVNVAASREKGGTGLGLAIVKHILNRHRGELLVDSKVGQGSTFTVALPVAQD
jgi:two-component system phosphate regulon sensor histidine kinase PhoR